MTGRQKSGVRIQNPEEKAKKPEAGTIYFLF
jgi:hypothetical protein